MKIVVVGIGKVGRTLSEHLADEGHEITVIDTCPRIVSQVSDILDVIGVVGNGANYRIQREAGAESADLLIAASDSDEVNILCCLVAKKLGVPATIARVRDPEYEQQLGLMKEELGISLSINPEREVAREIARILRFPSAARVEVFAKGRVELVEYRLPEDSILAGMELREVHRALRTRILVCAVQRDNDVIIPGGSFRLRGGDRINLTGPLGEMEDFFRQIGAFRDRAESVMIIGASRITFYLAAQLRRIGIKMRVIERSPEQCRAFCGAFPDVLVIQGDATDQELLTEEGLENCDAFVALTGLDELNIMLTMYAKDHHIGRSIAKINRNFFAESARKNNIVESIVSASGVTVSRILQYVRALQNSAQSESSNIQALHHMVDNKVEALEFTVGRSSRVAGHPLADLHLLPNLLIASIHHPDGGVVIPSGRDVLREGDSVVIVTTRTGLDNLDDILAE